MSSNHESIVRQNYKVFTAREGDVGGVAHWSAVLASGASEDSISLAMLRSEGMGKIWKSLASLDTANDALRAENAALRAQVSNLKPADLSDLKASIAGLSARIDSDRGDSVDYGRIERDVIAAIVHALSR